MTEAMNIEGGNNERELELRSKRICRFCLSTEEPLTDLYSNDNRLKSRVPLPLQILSSVSIEVSAVREWASLLYLLFELKMKTKETKNHQRISRQSHKQISNVMLNPACSMNDAFSKGVRLGLDGSLLF